MDHLGDRWPFTASILSFLTLLGTRGLSTRGQLSVSEIFGCHSLFRECYWYLVGRVQGYC